MHGALLRTGKSDDFIAMGETGQPVYKAALQIIAALSRKSPELANFLAVPKSNEQGNLIDWYSPVVGDVIPWSSASDSERDAARAKLIEFRQSIRDMSQSLVQSGRGDKAIFGKLLGLVPHSPDESYLYLVEGSRVNAEGLREPFSQPVLSFWGFVNNEADRHRDPLYFLTPRSASSVPNVLPTLESTPSSTSATPATPPSDVLVRPWWRRFWWLWPLLLIALALLMLGLLRGCTPHAEFGLGSASLPQPSLDSTSRVPPGANLNAGLQGTAPSVPGNTTQPPEAVSHASQPAVQEKTAPGKDESGTEPSTVPNNKSSPGNTPPVTSEPLNIPPQAADGPADFLNGNYRAGAGILDAKTAKPLRLEYAFEKGKGNVTIRRPDGVSCTGGVSAAMSGGNLGIDSQDQATCTDGSSYDMPQVTCKPDAQSIADCQGAYGENRFPMTMRRE